MGVVLVAIDISWGTKTINVNQIDMVLIQTVPSIIYQLDLDVFRLALKSLEDSSDGMAFERTHKHNTTVSVGGASLARVIEIINDYTVKFEETGTPYRVNTVGANSNIGERVDLGVGQVSISTSNSAGLQDLNSLQAASFDGGVTIDTASQFSGTSFPIGTRANPVNNITDAIAIAEQRGLFVINIASDLTIISTDVSKGYTFRGNSSVTNTLTLESAANVENCTFTNLTIQGSLDNGNILRECNILDILHNNGFIFECALNGTVTLGGGIQSNILDCYSGFAGNANTATIDMGGAGQPLVLRNYSGGITLKNKTGVDSVSIDIVSGQIILEPTVNNGDIVCRGVGRLLDRSTGTVIVDHTGLITGTATVQSSETVQVDMTTSNTGVDYPIGTTFAPVNNMEDALIIASKEFVKNIHFYRNGTILATHDISNLVIKGDSALQSFITITAGATTLNTAFEECTLTGTLNGQIILRDAVAYNLSGVSGYIHQTALSGVITLDGAGNTNILDSFAADVASASVIDMNGSGSELSIRNHNGEIKIINKTGVETVHLDFNAGSIEIDATVTNGTIIIHGNATVIDNSTGTTNVVMEVLNSNTISDGVWTKDTTEGFASDTTGSLLQKIKIIFKLLLS